MRGGCAWRLLPHDFLPWQTAYHYFRAWRIDGTWERIHSTLRERTRLQEGRRVSPSAAILDSQSVRTTEKRGARGDTTEPEEGKRAQTPPFRNRLKRGCEAIARYPTGHENRAYQTDLSDAEWVLIQPHLPAPRAPGRPRVHPLREEILDAVFYVVRGGCTWRLLPHDLERPGKPSTTTSASGALTALGSGCTRHCAGGRGYTSGETRSPALASLTARASRPPALAAKSVATTRARR